MKDEVPRLATALSVPAELGALTNIRKAHAYGMFRLGPAVNRSHFHYVIGEGVHHIRCTPDIVTALDLPPDQFNELIETLQAIKKLTQ